MSDSIFYPSLRYLHDAGGEYLDMSPSYASDQCPQSDIHCSRDKMVTPENAVKSFSDQAIQKKEEEYGIKKQAFGISLVRLSIFFHAFVIVMINLKALYVLTQNNFFEDRTSNLIYCLIITGLGLSMFSCINVILLNVKLLKDPELSIKPLGIKKLWSLPFFLIIHYGIATYAEVIRKTGSNLKFMVCNNLYYLRLILIAPVYILAFIVLSSSNPYLSFLKPYGLSKSVSSGENKRILKPFKRQYFGCAILGLFICILFYVVFCCSAIIAACLSRSLGNDFFYALFVLSSLMLIEFYYEAMRNPEISLIPQKINNLWPMVSFPAILQVGFIFFMDNYYIDEKDAMKYFLTCKIFMDIYSYVVFSNSGSIFSYLKPFELDNSEYLINHENELYNETVINNENELYNETVINPLNKINPDNCDLDLFEQKESSNNIYNDNFVACNESKEEPSPKYNIFGFILTLFFLLFHTLISGAALIIGTALTIPLFDTKIDNIANVYFGISKFKSIITSFEFNLTFHPFFFMILILSTYIPMAHFYYKALVNPEISIKPQVFKDMWPFLMVPIITHFIFYYSMSLSESLRNFYYSDLHLLKYHFGNALNIIGILYLINYYIFGSSEEWTLHFKPYILPTSNESENCCIEKDVKNVDVNVFGIINAFIGCMISFVLFGGFVSFAIFNEYARIFACILIYSCFLMLFFWIKCLFSRDFLTGKPGLTELWPIVFNAVAWNVLIFRCPFHFRWFNELLKIKMSLSITSVSIFNYFVLSQDDEDDSWFLCFKPFVLKGIDNEHEGKKNEIYT